MGVTFSVCLKSTTFFLHLLEVKLLYLNRTKTALQHLTQQFRNIDVIQHGTKMVGF